MIDIQKYYMDKHAAVTGNIADAQKEKVDNKPIKSLDTEIKKTPISTGKAPTADAGTPSGAPVVKSKQTEEEKYWADIRAMRAKQEAAKKVKIIEGRKSRLKNIEEVKKSIAQRKKELTDTRFNHDAERNKRVRNDLEKAKEKLKWLNSNKFISRIEEGKAKQKDEFGGQNIYMGSDYHDNTYKDYLMQEAMTKFWADKARAEQRLADAGYFSRVGQNLYGYGSGAVNSATLGLKNWASKTFGGADNADQRALKNLRDFRGDVAGLNRYGLTGTLFDGEHTEEELAAIEERAKNSGDWMQYLGPEADKYLTKDQKKKRDFLRDRYVKEHTEESGIESLGGYVTDAAMTLGTGGVGAIKRAVTGGGKKLAGWGGRGFRGAKNLLSRGGKKALSATDDIVRNSLDDVAKAIPGVADNAAAAGINSIDDAAKAVNKLDDAYKLSFNKTKTMTDQMNVAKDMAANPSKYINDTLKTTDDVIQASLSKTQQLQSLHGASIRETLRLKSDVQRAKTALGKLQTLTGEGVEQAAKGRVGKFVGRVRNLDKKFTETIGEPVGNFGRKVLAAPFKGAAKVHNLSNKAATSNILKALKGVDDKAVKEITELVAKNGGKFTDEVYYASMKALRKNQGMVNWGRAITGKGAAPGMGLRSKWFGTGIFSPHHKMGKIPKFLYGSAGVADIAARQGVGTDLVRKSTFGLLDPVGKESIFSGAAVADNPRNASAIRNVKHEERRLSRAEQFAERKRRTGETDDQVESALGWDSNGETNPMKNLKNSGKSLLGWAAQHPILAAGSLYLLYKMFLGGGNNYQMGPMGGYGMGPQQGGNFITNNPWLSTALLGGGGLLAANQGWLGKTPQNWTNNLFGGASAGYKDSAYKDGSKSRDATKRQRDLEGVEKTVAEETDKARGKKSGEKK